MSRETDKTLYILIYREIRILMMKSMSNMLILKMRLSMSNMSTLQPPAKTKGQRSANHVWRNRQNSLYTDLQSDQNIDDEVHEQHVDPQDEVFEQPEVRGYTYMPHIWAISSKQSNIQPLKIEFNKYGQPIGRNKSKYVEFLGTIVRNGNLAPLNFKDWHKVPASLKKDMLDKVKGIYVVPIGYDKFVLQALGKNWRAFKCRIKTKYFNSKATMEQNLRRRPDNQNAAFAQVYEMTKEEGLSNVGIEENDIDDEESGISDLTRAEIFSKCYSRDGNTSNPKVANALGKMQKLKSQLPPGARDGGLNDIYSQVLGKDKGGRVCMYGYGVTTKDAYGGHSLGQDDIHHIGMEKELEEKNKLIERLLRNVDLRGQSSNTKAPSTSRNSALAHSTGPSTANTRPLQVGKKVLLKRHGCSCHCCKGLCRKPEWCEVKVIVAIVYDEPLLRKVGGVKVVEQAIGRSIAWPKHLVQVEDER
ncbi:hypothetical protein ACS0TY_017402 [Phlomoides rotata]